MLIKSVVFVLSILLSADLLRAGEPPIAPPSLAALLREQSASPLDQLSHLPAASASRVPAWEPEQIAPQPEAAPQSLVRAWGYNSNGQLGNGTTTNSTSPVTVSPNGTFTGTGVTSLAAGGNYSLALQSGAVYAWGRNDNGQLGNNSTTQSNVPVAVSSANGFTNTGVTAIAAGGFHSLAIQNGALYAWGNNGNGQLGNNSTTQSNVPVKVLTLSTGVTGVAGGGYHSLAIQNGNVFAWGFNGNGQLGNGTTTQSLTPVEVSFGGTFLGGIV